MSLVSAVGDKVRDKLRERYGDAQAEVAVLRQQKTDLERGRDKLTSMITRLNTEQVGRRVEALSYHINSSVATAVKYLMLKTTRYHRFNHSRSGDILGYNYYKI